MFTYILMIKKKRIYVIKISIKRVRRSRGETVALSISRFTIAS